MEALVGTISSIFLLTITTHAVPPDACFATFRWEDCGREPQPVMYYWKPGSRCEVGIWRGCLPNLNMFKNEFECVSTCIFSVRAQPPDFHNQQDYVFEEEIEINGSLSDSEFSDEDGDETEFDDDMTTTDDSDIIETTSITSLDGIPPKSEINPEGEAEDEPEAPEIEEAEKAEEAVETPEAVEADEAEKAEVEEAAEVEAVEESENVEEAVEAEEEPS